jgi:hypothetical protein
LGLSDDLIRKPVVIAWDDVLYAGYYVERGYPAHQKPEYVMNAEWHWNLFLATLENTSQRQRLSEYMEALSEARRCVWVLCDQKQGNPIRHKDETSLEEMRTAISTCGQGKCIDLILGVSFNLDECLALQESIVDQLRIEDLILEQRS